jgi:hypothetical protein
MKRLTTIIALFVQLLPLIVLAQQEQVAGTTTKSMADSTYYISQRFFQPIYLVKGEEKIPMLDRRGFVKPEVKAKFKPYPNAYREILLSEQYSRKTAAWGWVGLGIGAAGSIYSIASTRNGKYNETVNIAGTVLLLGAAITVTYHMILTLDSRRAAVDYLNLRQ